MRAIYLISAVAFITAPALAGISNDILVEIHGDVYGNQISSGAFGNVNAGERMTYSFELNSTNFVNGSFPVRGYTIDISTFQVAFSGGTVVQAQNPYPAGSEPIFVLRDNDPMVDGFFLTDGSVDGFPGGIATDQVGVFGNFLATFNVSYVGDTLSSLDINDAIGTYDFTGLTVFGLGIDDGPFEDVLGADFSSMTISAIPAPSTMLGLAPIGMLAIRRRR